MKHKNYTKEYLMKSIRFLMGEIKQTKFRIRSLDEQIRKEKQKLSDTQLEHDHLWMLRDRMRYELNILKMYKEDLKRKEFVMKKHNNNQLDVDMNSDEHVNTDNLTTMEILEKNNPQVKVIGDFFRTIGNLLNINLK